MKLMTWALTVFILVLFGHEQATAESLIEGEIVTREGQYYDTVGPRTRYIYPGGYNINLLVANDNLGCTVRVGTRSSNTNLLTISGPLAVQNVTDPLKFFVGIGNDLLRRGFREFPFTCGTTGIIRVSNPPTVAIPVMMTLTYGPFLKKTVSLIVTQKLGIKRVTASPTQSYYSHNQRVTMTLTPTRLSSLREGFAHVYFRVREGKLCDVSYQAEGYSSPDYTANDGWKFFVSGVEFFLEGRASRKFANLCHRGRTIVEFGFPDEEMRYGKYQMMTDSSIKRLEFNVPTGTTTKKSRILSRGIDALPPPIIPDPEPPALPNFELQGEKP